MIGLNNRKPIFLLGGFGGITSDICSVVSGLEVPDSLTESWQITHNSGYEDLQNFARIHHHGCDYSGVVKILQAQSLADLASRSGLDQRDYQRLMISPFPDECVHLILKGVKAIQN